ncbi:hypothetical protein [Thermococcus barophilus]|uniref:Uncharacterized protein n=1 Tax=Thermococcus barophilus TaxID=55802 RepID=A0A0S1XCP8_THEBA|nr:hypothetical protein [Thermococcus barophilus]ALM75527.1 hypothetical protein TBCH5v1_1614 [Thermococcus barophilus]
MKLVNSYRLPVPSVISSISPLKINNKNMEELKRQLTSILIRDLIDVYLRNPYYKRPIFSFSIDYCTVNFDKTFYVVEEEISEVLKAWANIAIAISKNQLAPVTTREISLEEYYGKITEQKLVDVILSNNKLTLKGNEVRKFSKEELQEIIGKTLDSQGAIFNLNFILTIEKHPKEELILKHYIFVPLIRELEFI